MSLYLRILQHLLPRGRVWNLTIERPLRKLFTGIASSIQSVREATDEVWGQLIPETTDYLSDWQRQFGFIWDATDSAATKRGDLAAAWAARGGQSPDYLEGILQDAGFNVWVHDPWVSGSPPPFEPHDPSFYTNEPRIGPIVCRGTDQYCCFDGDGQRCCGSFLLNSVGYLVNDNKSGKAPPPIPDDPDVWPFLMYVGPEVLNPLAPAQVPNSRRAEFERLCLKYRPLNCWIVLNLDYVTEGIFDLTFDEAFE